jgi:hypothetical protein
MYERAVSVMAIIGVALAPSAQPTRITDSRPPSFLPNAHISLIYWGISWTGRSKGPSQNDFTAALRDIVAGPWPSKLHQYHDVGTPRIDQIVAYTASNPPGMFTDTDVARFLEARITDHEVIGPDRRTNRIYTIILPSGRLASDPGLNGRHRNYDRRDGSHVYYNWILGDGSLTGPNSIAKMFSHELAETLTDADVSTGHHGLIVTRGGEEIADVCNYFYASIHDHAEHGYWSAADHRCMLPRTRGAPVPEKTLLDDNTG